MRDEAICGVCHKEFSAHQMMYDGLCQGCHELRLVVDMEIAMKRGMIKAPQPAPEQWIVNCFRSRAIRREDVAEFHISPPHNLISLGAGPWKLLARPRTGGDNLLVEIFTDFAAAQEALAALVGNKVFLGHRISKRAPAPPCRSCSVPAGAIHKPGCPELERCPACADGQWLVRETLENGDEKTVCSCGKARYWSTSEANDVLTSVTSGLEVAVAPGSVTDKAMCEGGTVTTVRNAPPFYIPNEWSALTDEELVSRIRDLDKLSLEQFGVSVRDRKYRSTNGNLLSRFYRPACKIVAPPPKEIDNADTPVEVILPPELR